MSFKSDGKNSNDTAVGRIFKHLANPNASTAISMAALALIARIRGEPVPPRPPVDYRKHPASDLAIVEAFWELAENFPDDLTGQILSEQDVQDIVLAAFDADPHTVDTVRSDEEIQLIVDAATSAFQTSGQISDLITAAFAADPHTEDTVRSDAEINALAQALIDDVELPTPRTDAEINALIDAKVGDFLTESEIEEVPTDFTESGLRYIESVPSATLKYSGTQTGMLLIEMPVGFATIMFKLKLSLYLYSGSHNKQDSVDLSLGGYLFAPSKIWHNTVFSKLSSGETSTGWRVRFGIDGNDKAVMVVDRDSDTSSFSYLQALITNLQIGHGNISTNDWKSWVQMRVVQDLDAEGIVLQAAQPPSIPVESAPVTVATGANWMQVGDKLIQWGVKNNFGSVVFPIQFKATSIPNVTASSTVPDCYADLGGSNIGSYSFYVTNKKTSDNSIVNGLIHWQAIGKAP